jgi:hypothetical protein
MAMVSDHCYDGWLRAGIVRSALWLLLVLLLLASCSRQAAFDPELRKLVRPQYADLGMNGKVKELQIEEVSIATPSGDGESVALHGPGASDALRALKTGDWEHLPMEQIAKALMPPEERHPMCRILRFDRAGLLRSMREVRGEHWTDTTFQYDADGAWTGTETRTSDLPHEVIAARITYGPGRSYSLTMPHTWSPFGPTVNELNANGDPIRTTVYGKDGTTAARFEYEYDSAHRLVGSRTSVSGWLTSTWRYEYNDRGEVKLAENRGADGELAKAGGNAYSKFRYTYEHDSAGHPAARRTDRWEGPPGEERFVPHTQTYYVYTFYDEK